MIRFILNFIFFGILFYAIYLFFPDAFQTLVVWAGKAYAFIDNLVTALVNWIRDMSNKPGVDKQGTQALFALFLAFP